jgi:hypothetical protein
MEPKLPNPLRHVSFKLPISFQIFGFSKACMCFPSLLRLLHHKVRLPLFFWFVPQTIYVSLTPFFAPFILFTSLKHLIGFWSLRGTRLLKFKQSLKLFFEHIETKLKCFDFKFHVLKNLFLQMMWIWWHPSRMEVHPWKVTKP